MQIVIDISDYDKEWVANGYCIPDEINGRIAEAIINGTPLPEHHGRLIDADALNISHGVFLPKLKGNVVGCPMDAVFADEIDDAPTIIEADNAEE